MNYVSLISAKEKQMGGNEEKERTVDVMKGGTWSTEDIWSTWHTPLKNQDLNLEAVEVWEINLSLKITLKGLWRCDGERRDGLSGWHGQWTDWDQGWKMMRRNQYWRPRQRGNQCQNYAKSTLKGGGYRQGGGLKDWKCMKQNRFLKIIIEG